MPPQHAERASVNGAYNFVEDAIELYLIIERRPIYALSELRREQNVGHGSSVFVVALILSKYNARGFYFFGSSPKHWRPFLPCEPIEGVSP